MEEGEGHSLQGDREAPWVHPEPVQERAAPGQDHGLPPGGRGRHAEGAAAVAQREPAARRGPAGGAEVGAGEGRAGERPGRTCARSPGGALREPTASRPSLSYLLPRRKHIAFSFSFIA